jgi:hypothetical protein
MPRYAPNKVPAAVKRRYFELIRAEVRGSVAARAVGVSVSCGSVWFVEAGRVSFIERPISRRYFSQDDRIEIADGLRRGESVKVIAARIGKSRNTQFELRIASYLGRTGYQLDFETLTDIVATRWTVPASADSRRA